MSSAGYERFPHGASFVRGVLFKRRQATQSEDLIRIENETFPATFRWIRVNKSGHFIVNNTAYPADADLAAGEIALYTESTNGNPRLLAKIKDAAGAVYHREISQLGAATIRRTASVVAGLGAGSIVSSGFPTAYTVTTAGANADGVDSRAPWVRHTTGAVAGNSNGLVPSSFGLHRIGWMLDTEWLVRTEGDIANYRLVTGHTSATTDSATTIPTTLHGAYFKFETNASVTQWQACVAAGAAPTVVNTGVVVAVNTVYKLRIEFVGTPGSNPTAVRFYINDVLVATITTTLPAATQTVSGHYRVTTLAALAKTALFSRMNIVSN